MSFEQDLNAFEMAKFSHNLLEKRKERVIRVIMESIKFNLNKPFHYFSFDDILRCSRSNTFTGDDTMPLVEIALERLGLTEDFPNPY